MTKSEYAREARKKQKSEDEFYEEFEDGEQKYSRKKMKQAAKKKGARSDTYDEED